MMKIKVTEETIKLNIKGKLVLFRKDDEVTVDDDVGMICVTNGWGDDVSGKVETGIRTPGASGEIKPEQVSINIGNK